MGCSTAAKLSWWPSRAARTRSRCSTSSRSSPPSRPAARRRPRPPRPPPRGRGGRRLARALRAPRARVFTSSASACGASRPGNGLEAEARRVPPRRLEARPRDRRRAHRHRAYRRRPGGDRAHAPLRRRGPPRALGHRLPCAGVLIRPLLASRRADVVAHLAGRGSCLGRGREQPGPAASCATASATRCCRTWPRCAGRRSRSPCAARPPSAARSSTTSRSGRARSSRALRRGAARHRVQGR